MYQAITVKFIGPSNVKGSRYKATCQAKSITRSADHSWNGNENAACVAFELATLMGWSGHWQGGVDHKGNYVFVLLDDGFTGPKAPTRRGYFYVMPV